MPYTFLKPKQRESRDDCETIDLNSAMCSVASLGKRRHAKNTVRVEYFAVQTIAHTNGNGCSGQVSPFSPKCLSQNHRLGTNPF